MSRTLLAVALVVLAVGALATAALASRDATTLKISAKPGLKFNKTSLTADAGSVTITMSNPDSLTHNVAIKGNGVNVKGKVVPKGGTSTVAKVLKAGKYTFYCSVPGHEAGGMKGTLVVK